jgi:hypothetical protein
VISHYTEDGRRVYTAIEAAAIRGIQPGSMRMEISRKRKKNRIQEIDDKIDNRTPVYYPEDLGITED